MKRVAVVILNWNGKNFLQSYLPLLIRFTENEADLIVADNASTDDSISFIKDNFPLIQIIPLLKNYGFAAGYNEAFQHVKNEFIVLLNQDVEVTENWLAPLVSIIDVDTTIAAVQPKIKALWDRNKFEYAGAAGGFIDKYGYPFCRGRIFDTCETDNHQYDSATEIFWGSGACLLVRNEIYKDLHGLDVDLFAHMEEIDLCWRMKNSGYKIFYTPESVVYHVGGGSLPKENPFKTFLNFRNNLIILLKNLPAEKLFATLLFRLALDQVASFRYFFSGDFKNFLASQKAQFKFLVRLNYYLLKRKNVPLPKSKLTGWYQKSVVWDYFVRKKKYFSQLLMK
jgi:GT2 family glycosyltransferase